MLTIDAFEVCIPKTHKHVTQLEKQTALSKEMLSVYHLIYGLKTISIYEKGDLESFLAIPFQKLLSHCDDLSRIKYILYLHTAGTLLPYGDSMIMKLKNKFNLKSAIAFGMTMQKCVSYFKAFELLHILLSQNPKYYAIVLTGEVAFSPQLRVVPRASIVSDASTAALFSCVGENHHILSYHSDFISGYSKGIYLSNSEMQQFDAGFIQSMASIILTVILKAKLTLKEVALILPHNINIPTWKKIALELNYPIEKIYLNNIERVGHTFCSDPIINLDSVLSENLLKKGDYYVMAGCGMGFYLSAAVFRF